MFALVAMLFYQGFAVAIVSVASPWIGTSFHLDGAGMARLFAWISVSSLGALGLSRMIDRFGRRRMILWFTVGDSSFLHRAAQSRPT